MGDVKVPFSISETGGAGGAEGVFTAGRWSYFPLQVCPKWRLHPGFYKSDLH